MAYTTKREIFEQSNTWVLDLTRQILTQMEQHTRPAKEKTKAQIGAFNDSDAHLVESAIGMEPEALKQEFGMDICFYGGMDLQQILNKGTVAQVQDETKHLIDVLGKGGGYIFGPGHTYIQVDAPIENILAMYRTAYEYRPF